MRILSNARDHNPAGIPADIRASVEFAAPTFFDANGRASGRDAGLAAANHALRVRLLQSVVPGGVHVALDESAARLTLSLRGAYSLVLALDTDAQAVGAPLPTVGDSALSVRAASRERWAWRVAGAVVEGDSGAERVRPHDVQHVIARCEAEEARGRAAAAVAGDAKGDADDENSGRRSEADGVTLERAPLAHACAMLHSRALRLRLLAYKRAALDLETAYGLVVESPRYADAGAYAPAEEGSAPTLRALEALSVSFWRGERAVVIRLVAEATTQTNDGATMTGDATAATRSFLEWASVDAGAARRPGQGTRIVMSSAPPLRTLLDDALRVLSRERIAALERTLRASSLPMDLRACLEEGSVASRGAASHGDAEWWKRAHERFSVARVTLAPRAATRARACEVQVSVDHSSGAFRALLCGRGQAATALTELRAQHARSALRHALANVERAFFKDAIAEQRAQGLSAKALSALDALAPAVECAAFASAAEGWGGVASRTADASSATDACATLIVPLLAAEPVSARAYDLELRFKLDNASGAAAHVAVSAALVATLHGERVKTELRAAVAPPKQGAGAEAARDALEAVLVDACAAAQWQRHIDGLRDHGIVAVRSAGALHFTLGAAPADEGEFICTVTFRANPSHNLTRSP